MGPFLMGKLGRKLRIREPTRPLTKSSPRENHKMKSYHELFSPQITNTHWEIHTEVTMKNTYKAMKSRPMGLDIFHLKPAMEAMTMKSTSRIVTQSQAIPLEYTLTLGS